jgi:hypothetical protein
LRTKHEANFKQYENAKHVNIDDQQASIASFFSRSDNSYKPNHPRQRLISKSIVENLIVGCSLPISLVENEHFRRFLSDLDSKYTAPCRKTVTSTILPALLEQKKNAVSKLLSACSSIALTIDIWTDRRQHGFLGVTGHYFSKEGTLCSSLIRFHAFTGSHTGTKIAAAMEEIMADCDIKDKVHYIVTDNASNMKKAATFIFALPSDDDVDQVIMQGQDGGDLTVEEDDTVLDDGSLYEDLALDDLPVTVGVMRGERLPCFAHSLQLTVRDGLKKIAVSRAATAKCAKLASLVHQSATFKHAFEETFGTNRSIPQVNDTRWNSFYVHLLAISALDSKKLSDLLKKNSQSHLVLTHRELEQVNELVKVLEPFSEATNIAQGENYVTISYVVPIVVSLGNKLQEMRLNMQYQLPLVKELSKSLYERFRGIYDMLELPRPEGVVLTAPSASRNLEFRSELYLMACALDPVHAYRWLEHCDLSAEKKVALRQRILNLLLKQLGVTCPPAATNDNASVSSSQPATKKSKSSSFFAYRPASAVAGSTNASQTPETVLKQYIALINSDDFNYDEHEKVYLLLPYQVIWPLFASMWCTPATSAPVERVFSQSGIIMRPHRAKLSNEQLEMLMYLKCN